MPRNPAHPWVGEAVALDWANPIDGAPFADFGDAMRYRDGDTTTLAAGESFIAGFFDSESLLSGDPAVFTFAVVCSGSGTLRLSGGTDADWTLDDPGDASQSLGTFVVSSSGTVASDPLTRDVDDYLAQAVETIVLVECLAGSVTIEQVKLRIWPTGGPVGGWAAAAGFDTTAAATLRRIEGNASLDTGFFTDAGSPEVAFEAAAAELVVIAPDAQDVNDTYLGVVATHSVTVDAEVGVGRPSLDFYRASGNGGISGTLAQQPDPFAVAKFSTPGDVGTYGLDVTAPPDEVPGDWQVELLGSPTGDWGDVDATVSYATYSGPAYITTTAVGDGSLADRSALSFPLTGGQLLPGTGLTVAVTMPDARTVMLGASATALLAPLTYGGPASFGVLGGWGDGTNASAVLAFDPCIVHVPAYLYWSPSTAEHPLRLMQRGDALGMGSGRVLGAGTRQGSSRVFGSL